jgi:ferredoxin
VGFSERRAQRRGRARKERIMKATVTEDCTACELCVEICPDVFEMGDEIARVKVDEVPAEAADACREAAESCPVAAIEIDE